MVSLSRISSQSERSSSGLGSRGRRKSTRKQAETIASAADSVGRGVDSPSNNS